MRNKTSICNLSLSEAFLVRVKEEAETSISVANQKSIEGGPIGVVVTEINSDKQTFIEGYLQKLYASKQGIFCKQRSHINKKKNHFVYDCERTSVNKGEMFFI